MAVFADVKNRKENNASQDSSDSGNDNMSGGGSGDNSSTDDGGNARNSILDDQAGVVYSIDSSDSDNENTSEDDSGDDGTDSSDSDSENMSEDDSGGDGTDDGGKARNSILDDELASVIDDTEVLANAQVIDNGRNAIDDEDVEVLAVDEGASQAIDNGKKPKMIKWHIIGEYSTREECMDTASGYSVSNVVGRKKHVLHYMRCNGVLQNGVQCDSRRLALKYNTKLGWGLKSNELPHTCRQIANKMAPEVRAQVENMRTVNIEPSLAERALIGQFGEHAPSKKTIYNMNHTIDKHRKINFSTLNDLNSWLSTNSEPGGDDDPFVLNSLTNHSTTPTGMTSSIQYVISTPRLLRVACNMKIAGIDATYKLTIHGYSIIILGMIDANHYLHVIAFGVTSQEETANYYFFFETMKNATVKYVNETFMPEILIADNANAIRAGFRESFPNAKKVVSCWFHVKKNIKSRQKNKDVLADIDKIHLSHSKQMFERSVQLFTSKWEKEMPEFIDYFNRQWTKDHSGWYEGFVERCPSTNNGLEGFNSVLKRVYTHRALLPLGVFHGEVYRCLQAKSIEHIDINIPAEIAIDDFLWQQAIEWNAKIVPIVKFTVSPTATKQYIPSSDFLENKGKIDSDIIHAFDTMEAVDFDELMKLMFSVWKLKFDSKNWRESMCTCPPCQRKGLCKHIIGTAISLGILTPPPQAFNVPLKRAKNRIPRARALKALNRQPQLENLEPSTSASLNENGASSVCIESFAAFSPIENQTPASTLDRTEIEHQIDNQLPSSIFDQTEIEYQITEIEPSSSLQPRNTLTIQHEERVNSQFSLFRIYFHIYSL